MRRIFLVGAAVAALAMATPVLAQSNDDSDAAIGAPAGGATGGTIGFLLGGPIGAIFGGFAGAAIGAGAAVSDETVRYAGEHPVDAIYLDADLEVGFVLDDDVTIHEIEGDDAYGYIYANNRVYIVDLESRAIVYSPGFLIPERVVAYVESNPTATIEFDGDLSAGVEIDADIELAEVPDDPMFGYIYVDDRPILVDRNSRRIIWIR